MPGRSTKVSLTNKSRYNTPVFGSLPLLEIFEFLRSNLSTTVEKLCPLSFVSPFLELGDEDAHVGSRYIIFKLPSLKLFLPFSLTSYGY